MDRKVLILGCILVCAVLLIPATIATVGKPECKDGIDNDGDGLFDTDDPGCIDKNDRSELNPDVECDDGTDNDGDGAADYNDGGCSDPLDNDETDCGDGVCEGGETYADCPDDCPIPNSCSDTDGGFEIEVMGIISGYYDENPYSYTDFCNGTTLIEYYCSGWQANSNPYECAANQTMTCVDGACATV